MRYFPLILFCLFCLFYLCFPAPASAQESTPAPAEEAPDISSEPSPTKDTEDTEDTSAEKRSDPDAQSPASSPEQEDSALDVVDPAYSPSRYAALWKRSPFTLASVVETQAVSSFADALAIVAIGNVGPHPFIRVINKSTQERFTIHQNPTADGLTLVDLEINRDPEKVVARISNGTEVAEIRYDYLLLQAGPSAPPAADAAAAPPAANTSTPSATTTPTRPPTPRAAPNTNRSRNTSSSSSSRPRRQIQRPNRPPAQ